MVKGVGLGLDEKAIEAVKKWKFIPGKKNGAPCRSTRLWKSISASSENPVLFSSDLAGSFGSWPFFVFFAGLQQAGLVLALSRRCPLDRDVGKALIRTPRFAGYVRTSRTIRGRTPEAESGASGRARA